MVAIAEKAKEEFLKKLSGFALIEPVKIEISREKTSGRPASSGPCDNYSVYGVFLNPDETNKKAQALGLTQYEEQHIRYLCCHEIAHQFTWKFQKQLEELHGKTQYFELLADLIPDEIVTTAFPQYKEIAEKYYDGQFSFRE